MSTELTPEEVKKECITSMGSELGSLFYELRNECLLLHWKWEEYVALFGTNSRRVNLINKAAGAFFWVVQNTLWKDVLLSIARLTDPVNSGNGKDNLTLQTLLSLAAPADQGEVKKHLTDCLVKTEFARDWRNRHIAHTDLALALSKQSARPLAIASRQTVNEALASFVELLNTVQLRYTNATAIYKVSPLGNAESLLYVLRDGLESRENRYKRLKSGDYGPDDLGPREPL